jgi:hypothetical protein
MKCYFVQKYTSNFITRAVYEILCQRKIGREAAPKMLVKLTAADLQSEDEQNGAKEH